ncbi:hypothetical protein RJ639_041737, partial [Escallonia herrerae]
AELYTQRAIDNVQYLGDVGDTSVHLLECILPHCTAERLRDIENSTKGRDPSSVTNELWKKFYELTFGSQNTNLVVKRMREKKASRKWRKMYEAKLKDIE